MYSSTMISDKDKKLEEMITEILEDFSTYSTNLSSSMARVVIAKQIVKKINRMYDLNIKYFYK